MLSTSEAPTARTTSDTFQGRPLVDPDLFGFNCWKHGLGHALNAEQDKIDELDRQS
jgi:hypothetical protein